MADKSHQTEQATPRRLEKAREEGNYPSARQFVSGIQFLVFAICFGVMVVFTFLPPIVLTGLITFSLALSFLTNQRSHVVQDA